MPRTIYFEGRTIQVPDDFSDEEIRGILNQGAPPVRATPKQAARASLGDPRFFAPTSSVAPGTMSAANTVDPRFLTTMDTPVAGRVTGLSDAGRNPNASTLGMSLFYAAQQDPGQYARLLHLRDLTGIPPIVSAGHETEIQQWVDANRIDPYYFTTIAPNTAVWASDPHNAAVSGVDEILRLGRIEQNAAAMRAVPNLNSFLNRYGSAVIPTSADDPQVQAWKSVSSFWRPLGKGLVDPLVAAANQALARQHAGDSAYRATPRPEPATIGEEAQQATTPQTLQVYAAPPAAITPLPTPRELATQQINQPLPYDVLSETRDTLIDAATHPLEVFLGADTPREADRKMEGVRQLARETGDPFFQSVVDEYDEQKRPLLSLSNTDTFQHVLDPRSKNAFSRAMTGGTKAIEALSSPENIGVLASLGLAPEDAGSLISGIFSGQMAEGAASDSYDAIHAARNGDYGEAAERGVTAFITAALAASSAKHSLMSTPELIARNGTYSFVEKLSEATAEAADSKLRGRAPGRFYQALQAIFQGYDSLQIPVEQFNDYFAGKSMDPAAVAREIGADNYEDAAASAGGKVEVPTENFLGKLDPEHQQGLLPDVVDPVSGITLREHQGLQQWVAAGGPAKWQAELTQSDPETVATPEWQVIREDLRQQYTDAGHAASDAEAMATRDANVYSNLASKIGMQPEELLETYAKLREVDAPASIPSEESSLANKTTEESNAGTSSTQAIPGDERGAPIVGASPDAFVQQEEPAVGLQGPPVVEVGEFSIIDWTGYPPGVPRPSGTFRLLKGAEYDAALRVAKNSNRAMRRANPAAHAGKDIHHIKPVKFGGNPADPANTIRLSRSDRSQFTTWWSSLQKSIE